MKLKIKTTFLDNIGGISYSNPISIFLNNNPDFVIGKAEIGFDENGNHFANLEFDNPISTELYLYYFSVNHNDSMYHISFLSLHENERNDVLGATLKSMITE